MTAELHQFVAGVEDFVENVSPFLQRLNAQTGEDVVVKVEPDTLTVQAAPLSRSSRPGYLKSALKKGRKRAKSSEFCAVFVVVRGEEVIGCSCKVLEKSQ